jgi:hypothetical protein
MRTAKEQFLTRLTEISKDIDNTEALINAARRINSTDPDFNETLKNAQEQLIDDRMFVLRMTMALAETN